MLNYLIEKIVKLYTTQKQEFRKRENTIWNMGIEFFVRCNSSNNMYNSMNILKASKLFM